MSDLTLKLNPQIIVGQQTLNRLGFLCQAYAERVLVVADPILHDSGTIKKAQISLEEAGLSALVFDAIPAQATAAVALNAVELGSGARCQLVVGLGGAKTAEIAKITAILLENHHRLFDILDGRLRPVKALPYIAIPTTGRDPFLFTDYFIVVDPRDRLVKTMPAPPELCVQAIFDSRLLSSLAGGIAAAAVLDGLAVAFEAYCSGRANFFSDSVLEKAIYLYSRNLDAVGAGRTLEANDDLVQAGLLTALGMATATPGLVSALAYAVNARFAVAKSWISAVLLPYEMERLLNAKAERLAKMAGLLGEAVDTLSIPVAADLAIESVRKRMGRHRIPGRLKDFGLNLDRLLPVAESARNLAFMAYSAIPTSVENAFNLLKQAY